MLQHTARGRRDKRATLHYQAGSPSVEVYWPRLAGSPFGSRELPEGFVVLLIRLTRALLPRQKRMNLTGEHRADRVNGVVSIQTFITETRERGDDHRLRESELVFNDGVHDSVSLHVRHPDAMPSMVVLDKYHALLLIEVEPLVCFGILIGIVFLHLATLRRTYAERRSLSLPAEATPYQDPFRTQLCFVKGRYLFLKRSLSVDGDGWRGSTRLGRSLINHAGRLRQLSGQSGLGTKQVDI